MDWLISLRISEMRLEDRRGVTGLPNSVLRVGDMVANRGECAGSTGVEDADESILPREVFIVHPDMFLTVLIASKDKPDTFILLSELSVVAASN